MVKYFIDFFSEPSYCVLRLFFLFPCHFYMCVLFTTEIDDIMVTSDSSDSDSDEDELIVDGCGSPRLQRRKKVKSTLTDRDENHRHTNVYEQMYDSNLPEVRIEHLIKHLIIIHSISNLTLPRYITEIL